MTALPRLAVTLGDPAGIGPEVVLRAVVDAPWPCTVVGDRRLIEAAARRLGLPVPERVVEDPAAHCPAKRLFEGKPSAEAGRAAAGAVRVAARLVSRGAADALVTAPLNKQSLGLAGEPFAGHTELLAAEFGAVVRMMLAGGPLRVVLATTHLALREVPAALDVEGVTETCRVASEGLRRFGVAERPRLALAALNPHASDGGRFGDEEERILAPAIAAARAEGCTVEGPFPADTLFARAARPDAPYDAVVALYHDQGLIPVKLAAFGKATNVTLGLPIVRTSPDHGTAFDIAGQGRADPSSLREALRVAAALSKSARGASAPP
ncbi:MAG: 4-hydroxythreonine-4-phosphate dehydrogenase PdxA [Planctomycetota bacterium]|nr:MAG: 4-hydroxythreonine-4-phosphate dehydrogenase PdxA [Planctomycetota bacterium]